MRLIDADALIAQMEADAEHMEEPIGQMFTYAAISDIKHAPTVVELVRCKDCKYGVDYYHEGDCYCSNPKWGLMYFGGSWEFYCADAERRTDDTY